MKERDFLKEYLPNLSFPQKESEIKIWQKAVDLEGNNLGGSRKKIGVKNEREVCKTGGPETKASLNHTLRSNH